MSQTFSPFFLLELENRTGLVDYLNSRDFLLESEKVENLEIAGDGNMNVVFRVFTNHRSFILKQSRPWVNKYPTVEAPLNRVEMESRFYEIAQKNELIVSYTPVIYFTDLESNLICLEDFGPSKDYTSIYKKGVNIGRKDIAEITKVVSALHHGLNRAEEVNPLENHAMRVLNHQHIFDLPFQENNGFNLNDVVDGLQDKTDVFRSDKRLQREAKALGQLYLTADTNTLIHGDFYPGSWLKTENGFKMIDPEFCFYGMPEFEMGVMLAHLVMARQPVSLKKDMFLFYHFDKHFDGILLSKFAGIEIMRRVIGLAQLPLELDLKERMMLLDRAYDMILKG